MTKTYCDFCGGGVLDTNKTHINLLSIVPYPAGSGFREKIAAMLNKTRSIHQSTDLCEKCSTKFFVAFQEVKKKVILEVLGGGTPTP